MIKEFLNRKEPNRFVNPDEAVSSLSTGIFVAGRHSSGLGDSWLCDDEAD